MEPGKETEFSDGGLVADSRRKYKGKNGFKREWPEKALSSPETIEIVDKKWEKLGIGPFIASPSLKYLSGQKLQEQ